MTVTLKQVEAFHWIVRLGSLVDAAERLNLAQSTVSKRIQELEAILGTPLFDRGSRAVTLTRTGEALVPLAADLLKSEARFREAAAGPLAFSGPFRFGVTELIAVTWLSKLIVAMKAAYPQVVPEPEVDSSVTLFERLAERRLDLVIGLDPPANPEFKAVPLDSVHLQWMCAPGFGPAEAVVPLARMAEYPILTQSSGSGLQRLVLDWLVANGLTINRTVRCNSLHVLAELAAAGLGIAFLSEVYSRPEVASGRLRVIRTDPAIPPIQYFAVHRTGDLDSLSALAAQIAKECCDFSVGRPPLRLR
ncbi:LysR family transcriptional regulator [Inquilinus limosus]|uniref:LysR family transcriptional regulator n=1 Tax=Inquilinus limosus TaxID=171674 RepID=UPI000414FE7A|nr:LysR family transcriptional regulator [Inquilinus limosus]